MLEYNQITAGKYIIWNNEPYEVLSSHVFRKQQRKPVNQTKLKNLVTGKVTEQSFHQSEKVSEADISTQKVKFLFQKPNRQANTTEFWFSEENDPSKRFTLGENLIGPYVNFVKQNDTIDALTFNESVIGLKLPAKVDLKVTEAAPAVKGNTATGATKQVIVETGATINVPLFINEGDVVRINTDTGQYTERVSK